MIRLLLDQGVPRSTVASLSNADWDVVHVGDIGKSKAKDKDILDYARKDNRICVTLDADFHAILAVSNADKPSVIRIRQQGLQGKDVAQLLIVAWPRIEKQAMRGAMITITDHDIRIHNLPVSGR